MTTREPTHNQGWYTLFPAVGTVAGLLLSRSDDVAVRATGVGVLLLEVIEEEEPAATTSRTTQEHQVGTGSWEVSSGASGGAAGARGLAIGRHSRTGQGVLAGLWSPQYSGVESHTRLEGVGNGAAPIHRRRLWVCTYMTSARETRI